MITYTRHQLKMRLLQNNNVDYFLLPADTQTYMSFDNRLAQTFLLSQPKNTK